MNTFKIKSGEIDSISNTLHNNLWGYDFQRITLKNGNIIDLPINCTIQPILREFDESGTLINFEDLSSVEFVSGFDETQKPETATTAASDDRIESLINYYEMRLNECIDSKKKLLDSDTDEDFKDRLKSNWNVRINEISSLLLALRYGTA